MKPATIKRPALWPAAGLLALVAACSTRDAQPPAAAAAAAAAGAGATAPEAGLVLDPAAIAKLGVTTQAAASARYVPESEGYALVVGHEALAQAWADVLTAAAAASQSSAVLERAQKLADTAGAFPADTMAADERQAASDAAARSLAEQRLSAIVGESPPWKVGDRAAALGALAAGRIRLVRVSFPLGALVGTAPRTLRFARLDVRALAKTWRSSAVWDAPADASLPGRSFFSLLRGSDASEGERLRAWAPSGAAIPGVLIPAAAVVVGDQRYWCYVRRAGNRYARVPLDIERGLGDGYFLDAGVSPGDAVVTAGAGLLLARESNPGTEAD